MREDKLLKTAVSTIAISSLLVSIFVVAFSAEADPEVTWDFPRLDEIYMIEAVNGFEAAKQCGIDCYQANSMAEVDELRGPPYYWNVSWTHGFNWCCHGFNCRDHPDHAGEYCWFFNRTNDFELYPLTLQDFRLALAYIVGTLKEPWISEIYGYICEPQYWFVPYANAYYVNPYMIPYEHSWDTAEQILLASGFQHLPGPDGIYNAEDNPSLDDKWIMPNGRVLYDGTGGSGGSHWTERPAGCGIYGIFVACPGDTVSLSNHMLSRLHVRQWNKFFMGVETEGMPLPTNTALFIDLPDNTMNQSYIYYSPMFNHDHDIFMGYFSFGNTPDYLYDLFHPDTDYPGSCNSAGHVNEYMNKIQWAIKFWKVIDWDYLEYNVGDYPDGKLLPLCTYFDLPQTPIAGAYVVRCGTTGVYKEALTLGVDYEIVGTQLHLLKDITLMPGELLVIEYTGRVYHRQILTAAEMQLLVWLIQWQLFYEAPVETIYTKNNYDLFKNRLTCWTASPGYGAITDRLEMPWTYSTIHWIDTPVGRTMNWHCAGNVSTLNPIRVAWIHEKTIINRLYDSGRVLHPFTHATLPWIITHFKTIPWVDMTQGVDNGMIIKLWIRDDVYWHDEKHVTAEDIKWNFDFINSTQAGEMVGLWKYYLGTEVVNDNLCEIYVNATGLWQAYDYIDNILIFPKIIWEPFWGDYTGATEFKPWKVRYDTWTGCPAPEWSDMDGDGVGDLTCLYGTGPFVLDYWNEIDTARLYRNPIYWVRNAAYPIGQMATLRVKGQCSKQYGDRVIPKITRLNDLEVQIHNLQKCTPCTFEYNITIETGDVLASGHIDNLACYAVYIGQPNLDVTPDMACVHTFILGVRKWYAEGWSYWYSLNTLDAGLLIGDLNCDCWIGFWDLLKFASCYGACVCTPVWHANDCSRADLDCDGCVGFWDLLEFAGWYGHSCHC